MYEYILVQVCLQINTQAHLLLHAAQISCTYVLDSIRCIESQQCHPCRWYSFFIHAHPLNLLTLSGRQVGVPILKLNDCPLMDQLHNWVGGSHTRHTLGLSCLRMQNVRCNSNMPLDRSFFSRPGVCVAGDTY